MSRQRVAVELGGCDSEIAECRTRSRVRPVVSVERGLQHDGLEPAAQRVGRERRRGLGDVEVLDREGCRVSERLGDPHRGTHSPVIIGVQEGADPADHIASLHVTKCTTSVWYAAGGAMSDQTAPTMSSICCSIQNEKKLARDRRCELTPVEGGLHAQCRGSERAEPHGHGDEELAGSGAPHVAADPALVGDPLAQVDARLAASLERFREGTGPMVLEERCEVPGAAGGVGVHDRCDDVGEPLLDWSSAPRGDGAGVRANGGVDGGSQELVAGREVVEKGPPGDSCELRDPVEGERRLFGIDDEPLSRIEDELPNRDAGRGCSCLDHLCTLQCKDCTVECRNLERALMQIVRSGRTIAYELWGPEHGEPVVFLHGGLLSRLVRPVDDSLLERLGTRLVTFDRPGYGRSEPDEHPQLLDRADDLFAILDELGVGSARLVGWSAGVPHALACAAHRPDRVTRIDAVATPVVDGHQSQVPQFALAASAPDAFCSMVADRIAQRSPKDAVPSWVTESAYLAAGADAHIIDQLVDALNEGIRQGAVGACNDMFAIAAPWGFELSEITCPVRVWHGSNDTVSDVAYAQLLAGSVAAGELRVVAGGHDVVFDLWPTILAGADWPPAPQESATSAV